MNTETVIDPLSMQPERPIIFGEILFDCFADRKVAGGAPLNVAWHLQALGWNPLLISRIGMDDEGREILSLVREWGMDTSGIQHDKTHPTGRVEITMQGNEHTFHILEKQAYDFIAAEKARCAVNLQQAGVLYHGSLALRAESKETYLQLTETLDAPVFLDINLRDPWWTKEFALELIDRADILKLNLEELKLLHPSSLDNTSSEQIARQACKEWNLKEVWLTLGAEGAVYSSANGECYRVKPEKSDTPIIDTVGAGDAFTAAVLGGILKASNPRDIADCAILLAARICHQKGATAPCPELYKNLEKVSNC